MCENIQHFQNNVTCNQEKIRLFCGFSVKKGTEVNYD